FNEIKIKKLKELDIERLQEILISLNPSLHNTTDLKEKERIIKAIIIQKANQTPVSGKHIIKPLVLGVKLEREEIKKRITERLKRRLDEGMIEEVEELVKSGISYEKLIFFGLEYKFIGQHLSGELNYNDMFQKLNSAIHNFAKRQMTWFRKMEKEGINIHWLNGPDFEIAKEILSLNLSRFKI
ncbi:MAG: tRNA dimethylallyltransferase, partial [Ignavibacteriaceae bacterium]